MRARGFSLLRLLAGAARPSTGSVKIDGFPLALWPAEQHGPATGYLPQAVDLLPGTIWQNVTRFAAYDPAPAMSSAMVRKASSNSADDELAAMWGSTPDVSSVFR